MLSAAGLARVSTLMFNRTGDPSLPKTVSLVFYSLINALSSLQSRSYLDPKLRARSILLAEALIFAGLPTGGRGDSHLSFALNGGALPLSPTEIQVPLFAEWSATSRYAASSYSHIYSRVPLQDSLENPAVPFEDEKDHESSIERRYTSLPVLAAAVLCQSVVSEEFSAALESVISDGLNLSSTISSVSSRSIWCPRHGILEKGKEPTSRKFDTVAPYPPAPLPFFTALCILRDLSNISGEGSHFYRASSERLVNSAISLLRSIPKMAETSVARFVEITNALHTLAPLSPSLKSDTISLNDVIKTCLSIISIKPKGASEPALPVSLGAAPSSTLSTTVDIDDKQWRSFFVEFPSVACPACSFSFISDKRIPGDEDSRNSSSDKVVSWMSLRSSLETSRWLSIASCLSLVDSPLHIRARNLKTKQSLLASLSLEIAEDLAIASMDALSFCNDGTSGVAALFVSGLVLRALPLKDEDHKDLIIANKIFGTSGTGEMAPLNNCIDFIEILTAIERMMILPKTSRRLAEAYASCIANPELFLRPALHVSTSGESYGPFLKHLFVIVEAFSGESANHHLLQCLTSKLCIAWTALFQVLEDNHSTEVVSVCRIVLRSHIPLMMRLLLHREFFSLHEEPALCDATARAQMREWIKFHRGNDEAEQFDKVKVSLRPQGIAGALVRIQVLCWLEKILMIRKTINRQTMLLIIRDLALLLLALNLTPEFLVESIPGSSVHSIKLRSWQALSLIAREWGRFGSDIVTTNTYSTTADVFLIDSTSDISVRIARAEALLPSSPTEARRLCSRFLALAAPPVPHNAVKMKAMKSATYVSAGNSNDGGEFIKIKSNLLDIFTTDDLADLALAFQLVIFKYQLSLTQQPSTRQYLEACSAAISRRFPATSLHGILLPLLLTGYAKTQLAFSLMLVCADLAHSLAIRATTLEKEETSTTVLLASLSSQVILATFPWTSSPMGLVRVVALSSLVRTVSVLFPEIDSSKNRVNALIPSLPGLDEWVRPLIRLSLHSPDLGDMIQRQDKHFLRLHPETSLSLESLLTSRCTEHGELISEDAYSYIRATFQRLTVELHVRDPANIVDDDFLDARADAAMKAGLIPTCSIIDQKYCLGFGNLTLHGPFGSDDSVSSLQSFQQAPEEAMNLQRKIHSQMALSAEAKDKIKGAHSLPSVSNDDTLRPHAATLALRERQHPLLTFAAEPPLSGQEGSIEVADGRKYQPAIVLASLVTKIPNLGGLARTCEVLGIQSLVVHDIRIRSDQEFKSISVSAADWLPIYGCRVENMLSYVRARRRQGYTIVGLEQAARSVRLGSSACVLPDQCVFVLGAEKEGIPVTLLQELDIVVEIPQLGLTRSMNVHVSASLLLWEYTRQRMKRAGFE
jgi:tRNA guanosine-2'-O-methyltransferase